MIWKSIKSSKWTEQDVLAINLTSIIYSRESSQTCQLGEETVNAPFISIINQLFSF